MNMYKLECGEVVRHTGTLREWGQWMDENRTRIRFDEGGKVCVSTIFTGVEGRLFDTTVFKDHAIMEQWTSKTLAEAREMHDLMLQKHYRI